MEAPSSSARDPNRRRLEATSAQPLTTAEVQAQRHGIPSEISNALQMNVPSRVRQAVNSGRNSTFGRTQSQPVIPNPNYFTTGAQTLREAEAIIHKDERRRQARELQPYGSAESSEMNALDLPGSSAAERDRGTRRLKFGADGEVEMEGEDLGLGAGARAKGKGKRVDWGLSQGKKRGAEAEAEEGNISDTATEVDEDEEAPQLPSSANDEFPPVFTSPAISHPDLFRSNKFPANPRAGAMLPPATTHVVAGGRQMRGLPGRAMLSKTVSAPVIRGSSGMDVDEPSGAEDGFDVSEWAGETNF